MYRTVWLATSCLAMLGALAVGRTVTAPAAPTTAYRQVNEAAFKTSAYAAAGVNLGTDGNVVKHIDQEPLAKGDRLEITHLAAPTARRSLVSPPPTEQKAWVALARSKLSFAIGCKVQARPSDGGQESKIGAPKATVTSRIIR